MFVRFLLFIYFDFIASSSTVEDIKLDTWSLLGPFLIGKTEIDGDPLENIKSCSRISILRKEKGCPKRFLSEISANGYVTWNKVISTAQIANNKMWYQVQVSFPTRKAPVDYNALITGMNKISVLEFQAWMTTTISISNEGLHEFNCDPIHSFYIDGVLYAGDIYSRGISNNFIHLTKGKHYLDIRLRAKGSATFKCFMKRIVPTPLNTLQLIEPHLESGPTDIVNGELPFALPSWLQLPLTNAGSIPVFNISAVIVNSKQSSSSSTSPRIVISQSPSNGYSRLTSMLISRHTQLFPFSFQLEYPVNYKADWWKPFLHTDSPCLDFEVYFIGQLKQQTGEPRGGHDGEVKSNSIWISLQCRHALQSFLFTFPDHDGSIVRAGALFPRETVENLSPLKSSKLMYPSLFAGGDGDGGTGSGRARYPVLLALSGVGVSIRSQVDAHKYKSKPADKDYTFGLHGAWVLAPCRDGAHNWEGTGYQTVMATLEYLLTATALSRMAADRQAVMVSGHSRGGHGALTVATHVPDRIRAIVSASGYADRESYGDANILFDLDLQLAYMDSLMVAIHLATIQEHDNLQLADNLRGKNAFIRAGGADRTVNPFFQRQIARVLSAEGVNLTYSEKAGADHWYWDFDQLEDGGVVFDPATRRFIESNLHPLEGSPKTCDRFFVASTFNPATVGAVRGIRILQMISRIRKAWVAVRYTSNTTIEMDPSNVRKFLISASFWEHCSHLVSSRIRIVVRGSEVYSVDTATAAVEDINICRDDTTGVWSVCMGSGCHAHTERGPSNYGPARQVHHAPFVIVVGSGYPTAERGTTFGEGQVLSTDLLLNAARYLSIGHVHASATIAPVVMDEDITMDVLRDIMATGTNLILLGGPHVNSVSKKIAGILDGQHNTPFPITIFENSTVQLGGSPWCRFNEQKSDGVLFTFPTPYYSMDTLGGGDTCDNNSSDVDDGTTTKFPNHLSMMISADTLESLYDVISFSFSSNVPLTRAPFSNMFADYYITSREVGWKGYGGLRAVGFWGNKWEYQSHQGWTTIDCS